MPIWNATARSCSAPMTSTVRRWASAPSSFSPRSCTPPSRPRTTAQTVSLPCGPGFQPPNTVSSNGCSPTPARLWTCETTTVRSRLSGLLVCCASPCSKPDHASRVLGACTTSTTSSASKPTKSGRWWPVTRVRAPKQWQPVTMLASPSEHSIRRTRSDRQRPIHRSQQCRRRCAAPSK